MRCDSRFSMAVFGGYLALLSLVLLFWPGLFLYLGFAAVPMPWVAITGYLVGVVAFLYLMAVRMENRQFYRWTVLARLPLLPFALVLVWLGTAPPVLLLLGLVDLSGAGWTALMLRREDGVK